MQISIILSMYRYNELYNQCRYQSYSQCVDIMNCITNADINHTLNV